MRSAAGQLFRPISEMVKPIDASKKLQSLQNRHPYPLSIQCMLKSAEEGNKVKSFKFLKTEIPVRLAQVMVESDLLPEEFGDIATFNVLRENYAISFSDLTRFLVKVISNHQVSFSYG